ncbi:MAG TPA: DNA methyltransferase [Ktedonobacteraceae bacterium]|nr:DNA methyltransferase [Ktedonobacteraceae bacterium]
MAENYLYYGDNLDILQRYVKDESVDLIYLDPPFNSNQDYNVLFAEKSGGRSAAQIKAFGDTWKWDQVASETYTQVVEVGGRVSEALQAFRQLLGMNDMLAYLVMMAPRLVQLRRVLKPTGSIYLHCDPTASHYLKVLMDSIFTAQNFRNEIIWKRANAHNDPKRFGRISDTILYYSKTATPIWNAHYTPYREEYYESHFKKDEKERYYRTVPLDAPRHGEGSPGLLYEWHGKLPAPSRTWAVRRETMEEYEQQGRLVYTRTGTPTLLQFADTMPGVPLQNIWTDIPPVNPQARERLGYPTQKPLALLERIIQASSNEGDIVLDPFCGCGTAIDAAQKLHRHWIGIDITTIAINLIKTRLLDTYGADIVKTYRVRGEPKTFSEAQALAEQDKYQFQWWVLGLVYARGDEEKKGADHGIDGQLYFHDEVGGKTKQVIFSVKGGHTSVKDVRDLRGVIDREKAEIGVLLTLQESTQPMRTEATGAGFYTSPWGKHPRLQILTIEELLEGRQVNMPPIKQVNVTFKKAPKARNEQAAIPTPLFEE